MTDVRDQRSAGILTSRFRAQVWYLLRGHEWPALSMFDDDVVFTTIDLKEPIPSKTAMLVEFNSCVADFEDSWLPDQARMRVITDRLRFTWFGLPYPIVARMVDTIVRADGKLQARVCNPASVGGPTMPARRRFAGIPMVVTPFLAKVYRPELDRALRWFMAGLDAADPFSEATCLWSALEALAPQLKKVPGCPRCGIDLPPCTSCGQQSPQSAVMASIRSYVLSKCNDVPPADLNRLYTWRSKLVHGEQDRAYSEYGDAIVHVAELRPLVERLLILEFDVPGGLPGFQSPPDHLAVQIDAHVSSDWHDDVLDIPAPLFTKISLVHDDDRAEPSSSTPHS